MIAYKPRRLRVFARVLPFWNPCLWAGEWKPGAEGEALIAALQLVGRFVPAITHTLE